MTWRSSTLAGEAVLRARLGAGKAERQMTGGSWMDSLWRARTWIFAAGDGMQVSARAGMPATVVTTWLAWFCPCQSQSSHCACHLSSKLRHLVLLSKSRRLDREDRARTTPLIETWAISNSSPKCLLCCYLSRTVQVNFILRQLGSLGVVIIM